MPYEEQMRGEIRLRWYVDGRFTFDLPSDAMMAYYMLKLADNEVQERMLGIKQAHQRKAQVLIKSSDAAHEAKHNDWGG